MRGACLVSIVLVIVGPIGAPPIWLVLHWLRPSFGNRLVESSDISLAVEILQGHKQRAAAFDEDRDGRGLLLVLLKEVAQAQPFGCGGSLRSFLFVSDIEHYEVELPPSYCFINSIIVCSSLQHLV